MRYLVGLTLLIFALTVWAAATRTIEGDQIRSSDRVKVWSFPASGDTLAGISATQTLSNKTISGASNDITGVILTSDVTGILPLANGGTGASSLATGFIKSNGTVFSSTASIDATLSLSGAVPIANGGTGQTSQTAAFDALSPLTTTGDFIYYNGFDNVRRAVGSNGQTLKVSSDGTPAYAWEARMASEYTATVTLSADISVAQLNGTFDVTLPTAGSTNIGKVITLFHTNSGAVKNNITNVIAPSSQTQMVGSGEYRTLVSDGNGWRVIGSGVGDVTSAGNLLTISSSTKTPSASGHYLNMTNNELTLTKGVWRLTCGASYGNGGSSPTYTNVGAAFYRSDGADSGSAPTALSGSGNLTVNTVGSGSLNFYSFVAAADVGSWFINVQEQMVTVTTTTDVTVYCVPYYAGSTAAQARVSTFFNAFRISP